MILRKNSSHLEPLNVNNKKKKNLKCRFECLLVPIIISHLPVLELYIPEF